MFKILIIWNVILTIMLILILIVINNICDRVDQLWDIAQVDIYRHAIGRYFNHD